MAVSAFGSPNHVAVLVFLGSVATATKAEILEAVPMPSATMHRQLEQLETLGLIGTDLPVGTRRGRQPRYSLKRDRCRELLVELSRAILGDEDPA
jgi:DNA-binding IclR family transcriptional regulator